MEPEARPCRNSAGRRARGGVRAQPGFNHRAGPASLVAGRGGWSLKPGAAGTRLGLRVRGGAAASIGCFLASCQELD